MKREIKKEVIAVWFSCGAASAVAAKEIIKDYGKTNTILIVNNPVANEHHDNIRFLKDCEKWFGQKIISATNKNYPSCDIRDVFDKRKYISGNTGAPCTMELKREARYQFEKKNKIDWHVLGFTYEEKNRSDKFMKYERGNVIPILIEKNISKNDCFNIIREAGIELPEIYKLGYPNANCIGCVKSSSPTYWNLVRDTFPDIFKDRAEQSKRIGAKLVKAHSKHLPWLEKVDGMYRDKDTLEIVSKVNDKGKIDHSIRVHLDDLPEGLKTGKLKNLDFECGIFCETK